VSFVLRSLLVCCAAALLFVPAAPAGSNTAPRLGMYYCFGNSLAFTGMLQLQSTGWYVMGEPNRSRTRITRVTGRGTYRMSPLRGRYGQSKTRITFLRGYLRRFDGSSSYPTRNMFNIYLKSDRRYVSLCRLQR
jgi:hypothetical protein